MPFSYEVEISNAHNKRIQEPNC